MIYQGLWHYGSNNGSCGEIVARKMPQIWHRPKPPQRGPPYKLNMCKICIDSILIQLLCSFLDFTFFSSKVFCAPLNSPMLFYTLLCSFISFLNWVNTWWYCNYVFAMSTFSIHLRSENFGFVFCCLYRVGKNYVFVKAICEHKRARSRDFGKGDQSQKKAPLWGGRGRTLVQL